MQSHVDKIVITGKKKNEMTARERHQAINNYSLLSDKLKRDMKLQDNPDFMEKLAAAREEMQEAWL